MKWFEHQTSAHQNKKIRKIEIFYKDRGGQAVMAAVGRFWRLHEIVGNQGLGGDGLDTYSLPEDYGLEVLADDLFCSQDELIEFLNLLASINSIDADSWRDRQIIYLPKLAERADTYTKRQNKIRSDNEQGLNGVQTKSDKIQKSVSPQAQAQAQAQEKKQKTSLVTPPPIGAAFPVYSCPHFEITQTYFADILKEFPQFPEEYLLCEFFPRMRDWCADNLSTPKHKRRFTGEVLKNPRSCFRNWLKTEDPGKAGPYRLTKPVHLPKDPPGMQTVFDPDCLTCRGSGRDRDGPCNCGNLEPIVVPDPKCLLCGGGGITKHGPCACLHQEIYAAANQPEAAI
jgi:hypothetical protein